MSLSDDIRQAARRGLSFEEIVSRTGAKEQLVKMVLKRRMRGPRVNARFVKLDLGKAALSPLRKEAKRRGMTSTAFAARLLTAIARDGIFKAVLDE